MRRADTPLALIRRIPTDEKKLCRHCRLVKPLDQFHNMTKGPDGKQWWCKDCLLGLNRVRYQAKRITERARGLDYYRTHKAQREAYRIQKRYGLSTAVRQGILDSQGGHCAFDGCMETRLYIDHDHVTGKVRGLICRRHNTVLGFLQENVAEAEAAATYLRKTAS